MNSIQQLGYIQHALEELRRTDCLIVFGKGLGIELLLCEFLRPYTSPAHLVLILNLKAETAELINSLLAQRQCPPIQWIDATTSAADRQALYLAGGTISVTSRILTVDFLNRLVPAHAVTGLLICDAHRCREGGPEQFIATLFAEARAEAHLAMQARSSLPPSGIRLATPDVGPLGRSPLSGFIKALTDEPDTIAQGFLRLPRLLRVLRLTHVFLYPRFHLEVDKALSGAENTLLATNDDSTSTAMAAVSGTSEDLDSPPMAPSTTTSTTPSPTSPPTSSFSSGPSTVSSHSLHVTDLRIKPTGLMLKAQQCLHLLADCVLHELRLATKQLQLSVTATFNKINSTTAPATPSNLANKESSLDQTNPANSSPTPSLGNGGTSRPLKAPMVESAVARLTLDQALSSALDASARIDHDNPRLDAKCLGLIEDLRVIRHLLSLLCDADCVQAYSHIRALRARSANELAARNSGDVTLSETRAGMSSVHKSGTSGSEVVSGGTGVPWLLTDVASALLTICQRRMYRIHRTGSVSARNQGLFGYDRIDPEKRLETEDGLSKRQDKEEDGKLTDAEQGIDPPSKRRKVALIKVKKAKLTNSDGHLISCRGCTACVRYNVPAIKRRNSVYGTTGTTSDLSPMSPSMSTALGNLGTEDSIIGNQDYRFWSIRAAGGGESFEVVEDVLKDARTDDEIVAGKPWRSISDAGRANEDNEYGANAWIEEILEESPKQVALCELLEDIANEARQCVEKWIGRDEVEQVEDGEAMTPAKAGGDRGEEKCHEGGGHTSNDMTDIIHDIGSLRDDKVTHPDNHVSLGDKHKQHEDAKVTNDDTKHFRKKLAGPRKMRVLILCKSEGICGQLRALLDSYPRSIPQESVTSPISPSSHSSTSSSTLTNTSASHANHSQSQVPSRKLPVSAALEARWMSFLATIAPPNSAASAPFSRPTTTTSLLSSPPPPRSPSPSPSSVPTLSSRPTSPTSTSPSSPTSVSPAPLVESSRSPTPAVLSPSTSSALFVDQRRPSTSRSSLYLRRTAKPSTSSLAPAQQATTTPSGLRDRIGHDSEGYDGGGAAAAADGGGAAAADGGDDANVESRHAAHSSPTSFNYHHTDHGPPPPPSPPPPPLPPPRSTLTPSIYHPSGSTLTASASAAMSTQLIKQRWRVIEGALLRQLYTMKSHGCRQRLQANSHYRQPMNSTSAPTTTSSGHTISKAIGGECGRPGPSQSSERCILTLPDASGNNGPSTASNLKTTPHVTLTNVQGRTSGDGVARSVSIAVSEAGTSHVSDGHGSEQGVLGDEIDMAATFDDAMSEADVNREDSGDSSSGNQFSGLIVQIHSGSQVLSRLLTFRPDRVVLTYPSLAVIRELEVFNAMSQAAVPHTHPYGPLHVFFMLFDKSQEYLRSVSEVRREQEAFGTLIDLKRDLVLHESVMAEDEVISSLMGDTSDKPADGKLQDAALDISADAEEPDIKYGLHRALAQTLGRDGDKSTSTSQEKPRVLVDMREFRSDLPAVLHNAKMQLVPVTLDLGDYILSPSLVVERKALSDLIQSLLKGRLYRQLEGLTRVVANPILLIEYYASSASSSTSSYSTISSDLSGSESSVPGGPVTPSSGLFMFPSSGYSQSAYSSSTPVSHSTHPQYVTNLTRPAGRNVYHGIHHTYQAIANAASKEVGVRGLGIRLVLLILKFPSVRILWSRSAFQTAAMFASLKRRQPQPLLPTQSGVVQLVYGQPSTTAHPGDGGDSGHSGEGFVVGRIADESTLGMDDDDGDTVFTPLDVLSLLPGVNATTARQLLTRYHNLLEIVRSPLRDLEACIGISNATKLYRFLHDTQPTTLTT